MIKIAFYTIGDGALPSTWFRVFQYRKALQSAGIHADYFSLSPAKGGKLRAWAAHLRQAATRLWQLQKAHRYDLLIIQKGLSPWRCRWLSDFLKAAKIPYLVDIDDAIYTRFPVSFPPYLQWLQDSQEPLRLFESASGVIAGNRFLADFAKQYVRKIWIIPTPIDLEIYQRQPEKPDPEKPDKDVVVGWSGCTANNFYFNEMIPVLNALAKKAEFRIVIISNDLKNIDVQKLNGTPLRFVEWKKPSEVEDLRQMDIGIMPLEDDEWSRGKCGLKALQYMALGIPAVCSPVGINQEIIEDGVNGFLAATREEWIHKLFRLVQDSELRKAMAFEARKTVETRYSVEANAPKLIQVIEEALQNGKS